ncbi:MAG: sulfatase-like hydrolase/transferase [Phenylobacterium sp.]|nr:sulfatase-like hydrolase/transferase [Phenylobacterium sp.]
MKLRTWLAAGAVVLVAAGGLAYMNRTTILSMVARARMPDIEPNRAVTWAQGPAQPPAGDRPPNVLLILVDDLGYNDISLHGGLANGAVQTPHIDSLARDGVAFQQGYTGNATCAPSRAAMLTGRHATRFGFEFTPAPIAFQRMVGTESEPGAPVRAKFFQDRVKDMPSGGTDDSRTASNLLSVPGREITVAEGLKARGYHTIHLGKWHLGAEPGSRPEQQGFDESLGFIPGAAMFLPENDPNVVNAKQDWDPIDKFLWSNLPYAVQYNGGSMFEPRGYMTDYLADEAIAAIKANKNRPFFMYWAPNAPHTPLQAKKSDFDALPSISLHRERVYGAMIKNLDDNIGRILQALKDEGLDQNTLVIFTSDNGGAGYVGIEGLNAPFRGFKSTFFEGGIRTPYLMRWPAAIPAGSTFPHPVTHVDLFSTVLAAGGGQAPTDREIDGVDLLPFVQGRAEGRPHQTLFWRSGQYKAIRDGDWKLQFNGARDDKVWLYNLAVDPTEKNDLAASDPATVKRMLALLKAQEADTVAPMWPSLLQGAVYIDRVGGSPFGQNDEYILWDN